MSQKTTATISPTEIIATIRRSAFPALVTEGDGDVIVLRHLEEVLYESSLTLIPAGGKKAVLEVFDRRAELPPESKVMFVVDRDLWVIGGVPNQYQSDLLLLTEGYSIEAHQEIEWVILGRQIAGSMHVRILSRRYS
jgi:hypothetical protein